jgi:hypothetical protein
VFRGVPNIWMPYAKFSMTTGASGPIRASVILANRSGVNAGERFDLRISKESIFSKAAQAVAEQINSSW